VETCIIREIKQPGSKQWHVEYTLQETGKKYQNKICFFNGIWSDGILYEKEGNKRWKLSKYEEEVDPENEAYNKQLCMERNHLFEQLVQLIKKHDKHRISLVVGSKDMQYYDNVFYPFKETYSFVPKKEYPAPKFLRFLE